MKLYCLFILYIFLCYTGYPQPSTQQIFKIVGVAAKASFSKDELNKEIANAATSQEVKEILWKKKALQDAEIQVRVYKGNGKYAWWTLNKKKNIDIEGDWILTQSKDTETPRIYSTDELKRVLNDTLAILDTLKLTLFLQDEDLNIDGYFVTAQCGKKATEIFALPYTHNSIMFSRPENFACTSGYFHINLHNRVRPQKFLGECEVFFITEEIKATLKDLAISLKETDAKMSLKDLVNYMSGYVDKRYGKVSRLALTNFFSLIPELKM